MGLNVKQFEKHVLKPTLKFFEPEINNSPVAQRLVFETIWHESGGLSLIAQFPTGPGTGIAQTEPPTFNWLIGVMKKRQAVWDKIQYVSALWPNLTEQELYGNMNLSVIMCRYRYVVVPNALPGDTIEARADYWFKWYNASGVTVRRDNFIRDAKQLKQVLGY